MLSKSAARWFFLGGTVFCFGAFVLLTLDTLRRIPAQTNQEAMTPEVVRGKHLWDSSNCMGCHTLLGEGAYYAPELTRVYERRGPAFITAMLKDPEAMYPGQRRMENYGFDDGQIADLVAFLQWIGTMDLNGFPAKPTLGAVAVVASASGEVVAGTGDRPMVFNQMCIACHSLGGQGGQVGPALDGVGNRLTVEFIKQWLRDPVAVKPDSKMPKLPLGEETITELVAFLSKQTAATPKEAGK
ncbi:MAG: c-type cytochrome [Planctomycetes bacterium]|nr:c-type cytochrome [Planctomycetota bacterium]